MAAAGGARLPGRIASTVPLAYLQRDRVEEIEAQQADHAGIVRFVGSERGRAQHDVTHRQTADGDLRRDDSAGHERSRRGLGGATVQRKLQLTRDLFVDRYVRGARVEQKIEPAAGDLQAHVDAVVLYPCGQPDGVLSGRKLDQRAPVARDRHIGLRDVGAHLVAGHAIVEVVVRPVVAPGVAPEARAPARVAAKVLVGRMRGVTGDGLLGSDHVVGSRIVEEAADVPAREGGRQQPSLDGIVDALNGLADRTFDL